MTERVNPFPTENSWFFALRKLIRTAAAYKTTHRKSAKLCSLCTVYCFLFTVYCFLFSVFCTSLVLGLGLVLGLVLGLGLGPRSHSERSPNP